MGSVGWFCVYNICGMVKTNKFSVKSTKNILLNPYAIALYTAIDTYTIDTLTIMLL